MTSLENLVRLKTLALAEDAKNKGGYNGSQYAAWCAYHDALAAETTAHLAKLQAQNADNRAKFGVWFDKQVALRKNA